jgi:hypothetical protein
VSKNQPELCEEAMALSPLTETEPLLLQHETNVDVIKAIIAITTKKFNICMTWSLFIIQN